MKRQIRFFVEFLIVLIALGAALFSQRMFIAEWITEKSQHELPAAVSFQEVKEEKVEEEKEVEEEKKVATQTPLYPHLERVENTPPDSVPVLPLPKGELEGVWPASFNLAVPFTPQAPHADWSAPFKEACEEASIYMVHAYYEGVAKGLIPPSTAKEQIEQIVAFENELFGYYEDTTVEQVATLVETMFGYEQVAVIDDPTIEQLKGHLAAGRPVIMPAAGRLLGNPNFQQPGPLYHMLVIRGYTSDDQFITNDPGTRKGEGFLYDFETLMNAIHDWTGDENIQAGAKRVLVIYPET